MKHFGRISRISFFLCLPFMVILQKCSSPSFDVLITGGLVYDGTGSDPVITDIGIRGDRIVAIGKLASSPTRMIVDARNLAVAPGFINMLSHSEESLIIDGRSQGEIREGVTTQIFGEESMGPLTEQMRQSKLLKQGDLKYDIPWTTLSEYLMYLEKKGISQNIASFIGAATIREYVIGLENKKATPDQLKQMCGLVRTEMAGGALGISTALIYAPGVYASTDELIELCKTATQYQGKYISHIRSEGNRLIEAVEELIHISREAKIPAEIYHLKSAGQSNWYKMDSVISLVELARREGLKITADMYTYPAGMTGLDVTMPPWVLDGGYDSLFKRLQDPITRLKISKEMTAPTSDWENYYLAAGSPDHILLVQFKSESLKQYTGKTLAEVAKIRGKDPVETIMDLMLEDRYRVMAVFFMMSEENIKKQLRLPWVSLGSDMWSIAPEGVFMKSSIHPRAYGTFARLLGKYVRDEHVISLEEAIHRLSGLPATNLGLDKRGFIKEGMFADVVVFDPTTIADRATFEKPHQYAVGMKYVIVNGVEVLKDGEHTGAKPGRALWGPGKIK
jgi:N-acyl-D-amino-acid deacylase